MTTLPFIIQASPDARAAIGEALEVIKQTLTDLKTILEYNGLYASDGTLGIDDGSISVHFKDKKVEILDTSEEIPF